MQSKTDQIKDQIKACKILAPKDGLLIHQNISDRRTGAEFIVEEGANLRDRQTIAIMPDMKQLQLKVLIKESHVGRVKFGQSVEIQFDSSKYLPCTGKVLRVSKFAGPTMRGISGQTREREYCVSVSLDRPQDIKLGAAAKVIIATSKE